MQRYLIILAAFWPALLMATNSPAHAQEIKNCTVEAEADLNEALSFVTDRLSSTVTRMDSLSERQKNMFLVKWPELTAVCRDTGWRCSRSADAKRHEMGSLTNRVRLCYTDLIELYEEEEARKPTLCDLVEVVVHEFGHANGISVDWGHKDLKDEEQQSDIVYAMGLAARNYCREVSVEDTFSNQFLAGQSKIELQKSCVQNAQCASGKCEGGSCVCQKSKHCGEGQKCKTPLIGKNYCKARN